MQNTIVVIQNKPTQFDAPFYAEMHRDPEYNLFVFYTKAGQNGGRAVDKETNITPDWDNLQGLKYNCSYEGSAFRIFCKIQKIKPEHVVVCGWYPRSHALLSLFLRLTGVSVGVRSDASLQHTDLSGFRGHVKRIAMYFWLPIFNAWHPVGVSARGYMDKLSMIKRPVYYFPYAVDVDWFSRESSKCTLTRKQLGMDESDFVVLGVMKWSEREDPMTLIKGVIEAKKIIPRLKLLLIGDGPLRNNVFELAETAPGILVAPGYAKYSELPKYYAISDVFVHPAKSEPYGVSVQEAASCGLPVLLSEMIGSAKEFLEEGINGDLFPVSDYERLAELLVEYAGRQPEYSMSEKSKSMARDWSYKKTFDQMSRCLGREDKSDR